MRMFMSRPDRCSMPNTIFRRHVFLRLVQRAEILPHADGPKRGAARR